MTTVRTAPGAPSDYAGWGGYFDEFAPAYEDTAFGPAGLAYIGALETKAVTDELRQRSTGRVLDAGAGTGRIARALTQLGWRVTALDVSEEMLAELARALPGCEAVHGALGTRLPFADESFDAAVSMRVLKYVADIDVAIAELARVVRRGGSIVLEFANARSVARFGYRGAPIRFDTVADAHSRLDRAGIELVRQVAGTRIPYPVWNAATGARTAGALARVDRAVGALVGGNHTLAGARSFVLVGRRA